MELHQIAQDDLGRLAGMYMHGTFLFGADLADASAAKQRRFHRWLLKHHTAPFYELPEAVRLRLAREVDDREAVWA